MLGTNVRQAEWRATGAVYARRVKTFADLANKSGGAAGRQIKVTTHQYTVPSTATTERPSCVAATEDDQAFIVVFQGVQQQETLLCVAQEHKTIAIAIAANAQASLSAP